MSDQAHPGGYPAMPGEPARDAVPQGPPPSTVANAVKLMFARAALSALGLLTLFATKSSLKDQIRESNPDFAGSQLDSAVTAAVTVGIVLGILFIALYVLLALQVRKGKSWARIVTIVLAALSILAGLTSLLQPTPGLTRALGLVGLILDIAIVALLVMKPSPDYFRRSR